MSDHVAGETRPVHGAHTSPLVGIAAAFKKLWPALAAIPLDAINDHRHPGWDEPFHRATPLMEDFTRAVCEARLVPVEFAEQAILRAEAVVEETIDRLNRRAPECLPGALAPAYLSVSRELENLAALCPAPAAPTSPVPGTTCTPPDEAGGAERGTPKPDAKPDDPFGPLRQFARDRLKGQERAVIEDLCETGGELSLADVKTLCDWVDPIESAWNSLRMRLNRKIESHGWRIRTQDRAARLTRIDAK